jgi:hypothetical protein
MSQSGQITSDISKEIQDAGLFYCPTCYSITKDLGIFARPRSSFPSTGEEVFIQWEIELSGLVTSASSSCQFCPLIACRLFGDTCHPKKHILWLKSLNAASHLYHPALHLEKCPTLH